MEGRIEKVVVTEIFYEKDDKGAINKETISCSICQQQFVNSSSFNRHQRSIHSSTRVKCSKCDHSFSRPDGLKAHKCKAVLRDLLNHKAQKTKDSVNNNDSKVCAKSSAQRTIDRIRSNIKEKVDALDTKKPQKKLLNFRSYRFAVKNVDLKDQ
jgi:hypothetical protein